MSDEQKPVSAGEFRSHMIYALSLYPQVYRQLRYAMSLPPSTKTVADVATALERMKSAANFYERVFHEFSALKSSGLPEAKTIPENLPAQFFYFWMLSCYSMALLPEAMRLMTVANLIAETKSLLNNAPDEEASSTLDEKILKYFAECREALQRHNFTLAVYEKARAAGVRLDQRQRMESEAFIANIRNSVTDLARLIGKENLVGEYLGGS